MLLKIVTKETGLFSVVNRQRTMANTESLILVKDLQPGQKNINLVFIILDIGKKKVHCVKRFALPSFKPYDLR